MLRPVLLAAGISFLTYFSLDVSRRAGTTPPAVREQIDALVGLARTAPLFDARDKRVLITGASSGIGEALAYKYAAAGAHLVLVARRAEQLDQVRGKCDALRRSRGVEGTTTVLTADVATQAGWEAVGAHVASSSGSSLPPGLVGTLDLLVLNVGISMGSFFSELVASGDTMGLTKKLMDVNFVGTVGPLQATFPALLKSRDGVVRIAVVSSIAGITGLPTRTVYSASKFALQGFFDALRRELSLEGHKNAVTMINPGVVKTDINRLREGAKGKIKQLDMTRGYEVDDAAAIMVRAVAEGRRDLIMSTDGSVLGLLKAQLGPILGLFAPSVVDGIVIQAQKEMMSMADKH